MGAELFYVDRQTDKQTDRQTDMMKIIVTFCNLENMPKINNIFLKTIKMHDIKVLKFWAKS